MANFIRQLFKAIKDKNKNKIIKEKQYGYPSV